MSEKNSVFLNLSASQDSATAVVQDETSSPQKSNPPQAIISDIEKARQGQNG